MPKTAKKETDETESKPATNTSIKDYTKRLLAVNAEISTFTESRKDLLKEAKHNGISVKELKMAVRIIENPPEDDVKDTINYYLDVNGQGRFFA